MTILRSFTKDLFLCLASKELITIEKRFFNCSKIYRNFIAILLVSQAFNASALGNCAISSNSTTSETRQVDLNISCPGSPFFKLSETPGFNETAGDGVVINIDSVDAGKEYADISISYPNGINGGHGIPFQVSDHRKNVRILAVMFNFGDGELIPPAYATKTWAENMLFGDTTGFDGQPTANSLAKYVQQNSYGKVTVSGEVYPTWVNLPSIETYRDANGNDLPRSKIYEDLIDRLVASDPLFFKGKKFDFLVGLTPGGMVAATVSSYTMASYPWTGDKHGLFDGLMVLDIPIDSASNLYGTIQNEYRISSNTTTVIPKFNPTSIQGVWLASDVNHAGINYFTGGQIASDSQMAYGDIRYIKLGTPLPDSNSEVIITYTPAAMERLSNELVATLPPDTLVSSRWMGFFTHEFFHAASRAMNPEGVFLSDLYQQPWENLREFDLMATGNQPYLTLNNFRYNIPAHLSGYSKMAVGYLSPYTLNFGDNETSLRLYKTEEDDFTGTNERIKLIKVPLVPNEDSEFRDLVASDGTARRFFGKEYLLLEWRYKGELQGNIRNFDAALPSEGLVIYHVIEGDPGLHGRDTRNIVRVVDATPPNLPMSSLSAYISEEAFSLARSPAAFGADSGRYSYIAAKPWSWKGTDSATTRFYLSPGSGNKTVYAKFMDLNGTITGETMLDVTLDDSLIPDSTMPQISFFNPGDGATLSGNLSILTEAAGYFGVSRVDLMLDGLVVDDTTLSPYDFYWQTAYESNGAHLLQARVYDNAGNRSVHAINVTVSNNDTIAPEVGITHPIDGAEVAGILDITAAAFDNQAIERVDFYVDGQLMHNDATNNPYLYQWDSRPVGDGWHTLKAQAIDKNGNMSSHSLSVKTVNGNPSINAPPVANAGPDAAVIDSDANGSERVTLNGNGSSDPNGSLVSYDWYENGVAIASGATPSVNLEVGNHSITLTVTDNEGASASDTVSITVSAANLPPVANAGQGGTVTDTDGNGVETVTLNGSASYDPDGTIVQFDWFENGALIASGATTTVSLATGNHNLTLKVTDNGGTSATAGITISVQAGQLAAPESLTGSLQGSTVNLNWADVSAQEEGFYIERGIKAKGVISYTRVGEVPANATSYFENLTSDVVYYRAQAFNRTTGKTSAYSNVAEVKAATKSTGRR
ncbi:MAG: Ig-like domain-containing protein [Gammaproteobacteria bacterium]